MAKNQRTITNSKTQRTQIRGRQKRAAANRGALNAVQPSKPSTFTTTLNAVQPHLDGTPISSLRTSRLASLAKKAGLREADLATFVSAHKLAAHTELAPDALFALAKRDGGINASKLAAANPADLRKKIGSAVKDNLVPAETLASFDAAKPTLARLQIHDAPLSTLVKTYDLKIPDALIRKLETKGINTLADLRSVGGLDELAKKVNLKPDDPKLETLVAHAQLSLTGSDVGTNAILMEHGYSRLSHIANPPDGIFINNVSRVIGLQETLRIQTTAKAQIAVLQNRIGEILADKANGFEILHLPPQILNVVVPGKCDCKDCDSAVSPLAYLADLMGYATTKVGSGYKLLSAHQLSDLFHQPFTDLPLSCDQMDEQVRQVRICIEVLRSYANAKKINFSIPFREKEAQYRRDAYQALLLKLGTSYAGLRASRGASIEDQQSLADRLGIPFGEGNQRNYLEELPIDLDQLPELDLERLFGLVDTTRDPLSHGAKLVDTRNQIKRWNLTNVSWNVNTDVDGCVYLRLSKTAGKTKIQVYRAPSTTDIKMLEATAEVDSTEQKMVLASYYDGGYSNKLAGELEVEYKADDNTIKIQVVPQFLCWRLQYLRTQWEERDWTKDAYSPLTKKEDRLPIVDPDLIGPDDFRDPSGKPFKRVWELRRKWVDDLASDLRRKVFEKKSAPPADDAFTSLFQAMRQTRYGRTNKTFWPANAEELLLNLDKRLQDKSDKDKIKTATSELWSQFKLTPEMLLRLLGLKKKHDDWVYDKPKNTSLGEDEWGEVINILVQAQKGDWYGDWVDDEDATKLLLGPQHFWISLRESKEGTWPPSPLEKDIPRIDPETLKVDELPDETAGVKAIKLWTDRQTELKHFSQHVSEFSRDMLGATNRIKEAFSDLDIAVLEQRYEALLSANPANVTKATTYVEQTLNWSVEPFKRVMELRARLQAGQNPSPPKPTDAEWAEMERLLTTAYKQYDRWKAWRKKEDDDRLEYWDMLKARLPRWRASSEARQAWQQALKARSAPALVDPDLLRETHLRPRRSNPALDIWRERSNKLNNTTNGIFAGYRAGPKTKPGLETRLENALGPFTSKGLEKLLKDAKDKAVTSPRLDQLGISRAALDFLARMHGLLAQTPSQKLTDGEWDEIASILTQVWKMRQTALWRAEEQKEKITLSPDWFKIPEFTSTAQFPSPKPPAPPKWRGTRSDVLDWEDSLQSRIDQEKAVIDAVQQAVSEVEELTLPTLRDALVMVSPAPGNDLSQKADWITENLLTDAKQSGCQKTTRIAQAIETLQQVLWGVRTGLLSDAYPDLKLIPVKMKEETAIQEFDEAWKWIGSYATWRAAMFVFLFPEIIMLPSLKRHQTPGFRRLVEDFRSSPRISVTRFTTSLRHFYEYFNDVRDLTLQTCLTTTSNVYEENEIGEDIGASSIAKRVEYLFATTSRGILYWSVADNLNLDWSQTYWRKLQGFKNDLVSLVGCAVFKTSAQHRLLYLFAKTTKDGEEKLEFLRLDLERGGWDSDASEISIDDARGQKSFEVILKPRGESETEEATPPTLFITYSDHAEYLYTLGKKGGTDESTTQAIGTTTTWSGRITTDLNTRPAAERHIEFTPSSADRQYWHKYVSGTSLCVADSGGTTRLLYYWAQHESRAYAGRDDTDYPYRSILSTMRRFCVASSVSAGAINWGTATPLDLAPIPSIDASDIRDGRNVWPVGFAVANIDGRPGLVWCYLKKSSFIPGEKDYNVYYTVGKNVAAASGIPAIPGTNEFDAGILLTDPILGIVENAEDGGTDVTKNGLKVAIATPPNTNRNYLVVAAATKSNPRQVTLYSVEIGSTGAPLGSAQVVGGPVSSVDGVPTGVGLAFTSLRNNDQMDAVVFYLMRPKSGGDTVGEYFVSRNWSPENPQENWSSAQKVGENVDTWFGGLIGGAAIAVTTVDNNDRQDLIVFHDGYGNGPVAAGAGGVDGFYRIGFDFGFEAVTAPPKCTHDDFKPLSASIPVELSGFRPMRLTVGDAIQRTKRSRNFVYLEEAFYFVPVLVALQLQKAQEFVAALDWFRLVYDYTLPSQQRRLIGLAPYKTNVKDFQRDDPSKEGDEYDWLLDPLNPHSIAQTRKNTYLRFTLLSIIKCFLDEADWEFTNDTSESIPRARELYMTAFALLYENELKPVSETCEGVRGELEIMFGERWSDYIPELITPDFNRGVDHLIELRDNLVKLFDRYHETGHLLEKGRELVAKSMPLPAAQPRLGTTLDAVSKETIQLEAAAMADKHFAGRLEGLAARFPVFNVGGATGPSGDPYPPGPNGGPFPPGPIGDAGLPPILGKKKPFEKIPFKEPKPGPGLSQPPAVTNHSGWLKVSHAFCVPQNPILRMLRLRANLNLYKIRTCRNISGLKRELDVYAAPTDTQTGLPSIGAGGQLVLPGAMRIRPTPYRYQTLIERAKQLVQLAMQIEQAFLSALEKTDAEAYALLKAKQDLNLSKAGVRLQQLRVTEAQGGVKLANLQRDRADIQVETFEDWINTGLIATEVAMIAGYYLAASQQAIAASNAALLTQLTTPGALVPYLNSLVTSAIWVKAAAESVAATAQAFTSHMSVLASFERKKQEWELSLNLARQDMAIADQQIDLAEDHVRVTEQERTIAQMQNDNAKEVVDFLAGKFTNKELYDWMSGVLERVYSFFLQQATAVAQLAQNQLAFERQETSPNYIQPDYWETPSEDGTQTDSMKRPDRRGLTGSARLSQDIHQLDQYAFDTNKRKQQLTKTISLAQLAPFEFQRFRETGILNFSTPMELLDRDLPGHYLRLIKRVRTSVIALIPPNQGIRATLSSTGLSRVVVGGDIFQKINLRRDPETVALSSPINATGLFDLEAQQPGDMLLPFEGTGVDTQWEFRMLKSSNQFDYNTIADVLLTIEYTALNSFDYYAQLIQSPVLNRPLSADRPYSFRQEFADAWYDLHNPDQTDHPMVVTFGTRREDFPPNLSNVKIQHVVWYVASTTDNRIELEDVELRFTERGGGTVGGLASTNESVISTRRGNAGAWNAMIGKAPFGQWELRLPKNQAVRELFDESKPNPQKPPDRVADILLVITYSGRTPEWPV